MQPVDVLDVLDVLNVLNVLDVLDVLPVTFNLACEGHQLRKRVAREFAKLSSQEVLFRTQAQSTGYEMLASRHPDCFTAYYAILRSDKESSEAKDKAIEELLNQVSEVWL